LYGEEYHRQVERSEQQQKKKFSQRYVHGVYGILPENNQ
jgi:hypothetical protein